MGIKRFFIYVLLFIILFNSACSLTNTVIEKELNALQIESNISFGYLYRDKFFYKDTVLDFDKLLKSEEINGSFEDVFCVVENKLWFLYSEKLTEFGEKWHLATVTIPNEELCLQYESVFCSSDDSDDTYSTSINTVKYSEKNGFYIDDKIVLTDKNKLVEINVLTNEIIEYSYKDYQFVESDINIDIHPQQLIFSENEKRRIIDFEKASKLSNGFNQITQLSKYKIYDGTYSTDSFFCKVQFCNDKYYIFGRILNWHGETYMVVFEYDFYNDCLNYLFNLKTYDVASHCLFVVPFI